MIYSEGGAKTVWVDFPKQKSVPLPDWAQDRRVTPLRRAARQDGVHLVARVGAQVCVRTLPLHADRQAEGRDRGVVGRLELADEVVGAQRPLDALDRDAGLCAPPFDGLGAVRGVLMLRMPWSVKFASTVYSAMAVSLVVASQE